METRRLWRAPVSAWAAVAVMVAVAQPAAASSSPAAERQVVRPSDGVVCVPAATVQVARPGCSDPQLVGSPQSAASPARQNPACVAIPLVDDLCEQWVATWDADGAEDVKGYYDGVAGIEISPTGDRVFLTGFTPDADNTYSRDPDNPDEFDWATVAFDAATGSKLWDATYGGANETHSDQPYDLVVSPDGGRVYVVGEQDLDIPPPCEYQEHDPCLLPQMDIGIVAYDAATGLQLWTASYDGPAHVEDVPFGVAVSPDGTKVFVTGTEDRSGRANLPGNSVALAYDADTGERLWVASYDGPGGGNDLGFRIEPSPDGTTVFMNGWAVAADDRHDITTIAYDVAEGDMKWIAHFRGSSEGIAAVGGLAVSPDGRHVVVNGASVKQGDRVNLLATTVTYDAATGEQIWFHADHGTEGSSNVASGVSVSPDGDTAYVASGTWTYVSAAQNHEQYAIVRAYDIATGEERWERSQRFIDFGSLWSIHASPDDERVYVSGHGDGCPGRYHCRSSMAVGLDAASGRRLWTAQYNNATTGLSETYSRGGAVNPDGSRFYAAATFTASKLYYGYDYGLLSYDTDTDV